MKKEKTIERYFDDEVEKVRVQGYLDGLKGKKSRIVGYRFAYMSGFDTGDQERKINVYAKRVKNLEKARSKKCKK